MSHVNEGRKARRERPVVRRSAEQKARLSAASDILALKLAEKRNSWVLKS